MSDMNYFPKILYGTDSNLNKEGAMEVSARTNIRIRNSEGVWHTIRLKHQITNNISKEDVPKFETIMSETLLKCHTELIKTAYAYILLGEEVLEKDVFLEASNGENAVKVDPLQVDEKERLQTMFPGLKVFSAE